MTDRPVSAPERGGGRAVCIAGGGPCGGVKRGDRTGGQRRGVGPRKKTSTDMAGACLGSLHCAAGHSLAFNGNGAPPLPESRAAPLAPPNTCQPAQFVLFPAKTMLFLADNQTTCYACAIRTGHSALCANARSTRALPLSFIAARRLKPPKGAHRGTHSEPRRRGRNPALCL